MSKRKYEKCLRCDGTGFVEIKGIDYICGKCLGLGILQNRDMEVRIINKENYTL